MEPKVRQTIVCEDSRVRKGSGGKIDLYGLINKVTAPSFPIVLSFCVHLCLTEGRGSGKGRIDVAEAESEAVVYHGTVHSIHFGTDPLTLYSCTFRISSCKLPGPGLYLVNFVYNEVVLQEYPILVEKSQ